MRIKGAELKRIIREEISRSIMQGRRGIISELDASVTPYNVDAGEFPWPDPKPWWANSAVAHGSWDKDENIIYDLVEKHDELSRIFDEDVGKYKSEGMVTPGEPEIEQRRGLFGLGRKSRESAATTPTTSAAMLPASIQLFRDLTSKDELKYRSQVLFDNLADRFFIINQLRNFGDSRYRDFYEMWKDDVKFLVDFDSFDGRGRMGIVLAACQDYLAEQNKVIQAFNDFVGEFSAELEGGEAEGAQMGMQDSENYIWTMPGDEYQYKLIDGNWHAKKIGSPGPYINIMKYGSSVRRLNSALSSGKLQGNPLTSSDEMGPLSESYRSMRSRR